MEKVFKWTHIIITSSLLIIYAVVSYVGWFWYLLFTTKDFKETTTILIETTAYVLAVYKQVMNHIYKQ